MFQAQTTPPVTENAAAVADRPGEAGPSAAACPPDGRLPFERCSWCQTAFFRRALCPVCASPDFRTESSDGTGIVRDAAVVGRSTGSPHCLALIEMHEGFLLRAVVAGAHPHQVHPGISVRLADDCDPTRPELRFGLTEQIAAKHPQAR